MDDTTPEMLLDRVVSETAVATALNDTRDCDDHRARRVLEARQLDAIERNRAFLSESDPLTALCIYIGDRPFRSADDVRSLLARDIASLDRTISRLINEVLHDPKFQKLESTWRGVRYLVNEVRPGEGVRRIELMQLTWRELVRDLEMASEFDQSVLFQKIYTDEFGTPGGVPFGLLLGDYEIHPVPTKAHPYNDISALAQIAQVVASAYSPFVTAAHPSLLGLSSFLDLSRQVELQVNQEGPEFIRWKALRASEDARFVTLVLPRMLMRLPYQADGSRADGFVFNEDSTSPDASEYLWGSAVYAFGATVLRAHTVFGWFADIKGVRRNEDSGGIVRPPVVPTHGTDAPGAQEKQSVEVLITENTERDLSSLGFVALTPCKDTTYNAFQSSQSIQLARVYDKAGATANARISAMTSYMLCVSRIAHHLKVMARDKIGSFTEARQLESFMNNWLTQWVSATANIDLYTRSKYPLRAGEVHVRESPARPGTFICEIHMEPHYQFEDMTTQITFNTRIESAITA